ncbi:hypothetical protein BDN72DRAFT_866067, partial [Pluteus cervinus]
LVATLLAPRILAENRIPVIMKPLSAIQSATRALLWLGSHSHLGFRGLPVDKEKNKTVQCELLPPLAGKKEFSTNGQDSLIYDTIGKTQSNVTAVCSILDSENVVALYNQKTEVVFGVDPEELVIELQGGVHAPGLTVFGSLLGLVEIHLEPLTAGMLAYCGGVTRAITPPTGSGFLYGLLMVFDLSANHTLAATVPTCMDETGMQSVTKNLVPMIETNMKNKDWTSFSECVFGCTYYESTSELSLDGGLSTAQTLGLAMVNLERGLGVQGNPADFVAYCGVCKDLRPEYQGVGISDDCDDLVVIKVSYGIHHFVHKVISSQQIRALILIQGSEET